MPPDPVTALARKWCKVRNEHADWEGIPECDCLAIQNAVREALEELEKPIKRALEAQHLGHYRSACCVGIDEVNAAIAALREGRR